MDQEELLRQASDLAKELVSRAVDTNELKKLVSYFIEYLEKERLLALLDIRWQEAERYKCQIESGTKRWQAFGLFIRSSTTYDHIKGLYDLIPPAVSRLDQKEVGFLLGWTARLMGYCKIKTGTVRRFDIDKGFGFIKPDDGSKDHFVHVSETPRGEGLEEKQRVSFISEMGDKGPQAYDVMSL